MKIYLSILLLLAAAMGASAQAVQKASLANNADNSAQTVYLYANAIPQSLAQGYVYVDTEVMKVLNATLSPSVVTGNSIVIATVQRAVLGTTATVHLAGTTVFYGYPSQFVSADPQGPCVPYGTQYLNYSDSKIFSCGPTGAWFGVTTVIGVTSVNGQGGNVVIPVPQQAVTTPANPCNATDPIIQLTTGQGGAYTCNPTSHTWQLVPPLTQNLTTTGNITGANLFGNLLTVNSLAIGGPSVSTPSTISVIAPTVTGVTDLLRMSVNNCPITAEYGGGTIPVLQAIVGCMKAPDNVTIGGVSAGLAGYSIGGGGTSPSPAVGVFGTCYIGSDLNAGCWGANFAGTNVDIFGISHPTSAWGVEADCNVGTTGIGGMPAANCWGFASVSSASSQPTGAYDAFDARITPGSAFPWKAAFTSEPGAATVGMTLWPILETAPSSPSQPIQMISRSGASAYQVGSYFLDSSGSYQFNVAAPGANFILNPAGTTNTSSPQVVLSSYSSGSVLQQGGMFLDAIGNLNLNTSAATFSQINFLNGAGVTVAEVDKNAFRIDPRTPDPGCSVVGQLGSFWISDDGTNTTKRVCGRTGGSIAWQPY